MRRAADMNRLQAEILIGLKPDGRGLTVVGDDAQSMYAFRAAEVRNILDFPAQFSPPATTVMLEQNYRSTQAILAAANAVIAGAAERFTKDLWSERQTAERPASCTVRNEAGQVDYVCAEILAAREGGVALKSRAVQASRGDRHVYASRSRFIPMMFSPASSCGRAQRRAERNPCRAPAGGGPRSEVAGSGHVGIATDDPRLACPANRQHSGKDAARSDAPRPTRPPVSAPSPTRNGCCLSTGAAVLWGSLWGRNRRLIFGKPKESCEINTEQG